MKNQFGSARRVSYRGRRKSRKKWVIACICIVVLLAGGVAAGIGYQQLHKPEKETTREDKDDNKDKNKEDNKQDPQGEVTTGEGVKEEVPETPQPSETTPPSQPPTENPETVGARKVYLTFDDGPSLLTDRILDVLNSYHVKATFFVIKKEGAVNEERYKRMVNEGHTIGLHSTEHIYGNIYNSVENYSNDVKSIHDHVQKITGKDTRFYRFPGGSSNTISQISMQWCMEYLRNENYTYYDWNVDPWDSGNKDMTYDQVANKILSDLDRTNRMTNIILLHDSGNRTTEVAALPMLIEGIMQRGMEILPITENTPLVQHKTLQ